MQQIRTRSGTGPRTGAQKESSEEFLTFRLGEEHYGLPILRVQEIRRYETPTALAQAPEGVTGVINLRGAIVPIIDLRTRFRLPLATYDAFTVVIIVAVADKVAGLVVDSVSEVCTLAGDAIQPAPEFATGVFDSRFITGMGTPDGAPMLILLDIDTLMAGTLAGLLEALPQ